MRPCGWTVLDARIDRRWEHSEVNPWPDTAATASSSSAGRHELPARRAAGDARVRRTAGRDLARRHSSGWIREGEPDCGRACLRTAIHLSGHGRQQRSVRSVARAADHPTRSRQQHRARPDHRIPWIRRLHEVSQFPVRTGSRNRIARRFGSPCRRVRAEPIVGFPNDVEGDASRPGQVDTAEGAGCGRLPWLRNLVAAPPPAGYVRSRLAQWLEQAVSHSTTPGGCSTSSWLRSQLARCFLWPLPERMLQAGQVRHSGEAASLGRSTRRRLAQWLEQAVSHSTTSRLRFRAPLVFSSTEPIGSLLRHGSHHNRRPEAAWVACAPLRRRRRHGRGGRLRR